MTYLQDVWSWQQHLRSGGSTSWREWLLTDRTGVAVPAGWSEPGAAQLEVVRRLALRRLGGPGSEDRPGAFADLADLVTSRSGPGRGLGQQPLAWGPEGTGSGHPGEGDPLSGRFPASTATSRRHRVGAPPVDPAEVPLEELVRVGVGALTELLLDPGAPPDGDRHSRRRAPAFGRMTGTAPFLLDGAPVTVSAVRQALAAAGHSKPGAASGVVLLAEPFDQALAQAWSARVQHGSPARWAGFVARWSGRLELPRSADLPTLARTWADRVGAAQVHVVVATGGVQEASRVAAEVLGLRTGRRATPSRQHGTAALPPAGVDVARRVNAVLGVRVAPPEREAALRRLVRTLPAGPARMALTVPGRFQARVLERAERLATAVREGGYPVHGSPGALVPGFSGLPTRPDLQDTLEVVLATCLGLARRPRSEGAVSGG
ncbi:MAG TPA: hypothetical protein VER39_03645 [Nocardioidaceae bacterium]|nr:hypothetical protein [Nocardioidaceae bacterium]